MLRNDPLRCEHCGVKSLYLSPYPNLKGRPLARAWVCITCGCAWELTGEFREKGPRCTVAEGSAPA